MNDLQHHIGTKQKGKDECEYWDNISSAEDELQCHNKDAHEEVFFIHHSEDISEEEIELDSEMWKVLLSERDEKELTETEKKEIVKLHRYFAHRSGSKLWDNLFHPAGKYKWKKKLLLQLLEKCEICKKNKRSPPRPKVGMPKAKDVNEVVNIDLKILKKSGKKDIGILYLHDEFSKLIKGKVINDKKKNTIINGIESKWIIGHGAESQFMTDPFPCMFRNYFYFLLSISYFCDLSCIDS